jgi:hypothetical protein
METISPPSSGRTIFREGLIFGVSLGIVHIGLSLLNQSFPQPGVALLVLLLDVLIWLGVFFWAGARGAKQTGSVGTGSLTGLVTAVFAGIIALIYMIVNVWIFASFSGQQPVSDSSDRVSLAVASNLAGTILLGVIIGGIILWLLGLGTGAGVGALGGLLGRSQSTVVPPTGPTNPGYGYGQPPMQPLYPPPYPPPYAPPYPPSSMPPYPTQPSQWPPMQ